MDDLEQPHDGPLRHMAVSTATSEEEHYHPHHVSRSCPDLASHTIPRGRLRHSPAIIVSLPDHLEPGRPRKTNPHPRQGCDSPPPTHADNLVLISCLMVDPLLINDRDFSLRYNSVQRTTQVDLNSLDLIVRPETWNIVLDFFSGDRSVVKTESVEIKDSGSVSDKKRLSELCVSVRALTVTLAQESGSRLAKATVRGVRLTKTLDESNGSSETEGRLGRMTIVDLTEHGYFYRERFQTLGEQALHVTYKKTPISFDSPDAILRFEMATVLYVHTKRFISNLQLFFARFDASKRKEPNDSILENKESGRTLLEVQAGAPIILLPVSSQSSDILVADLGRLNVSNVFVNRHGRSFDVMSVELLEMDLYAAERKENVSTDENILLLSDGVFIKRSGQSLLNEKCRLLVTVERCLDETNTHNESEPPALTMRGDLSTLEGTLELAHYRLIKGLLAHNLGEPIDEIRIPDDTNAQRITPVNDSRSTLTLLQLGLQNVTVHLHEDGGEPLATVHFIRSKLTVENFSDGAQDVDLLSQEIVVIDTRRNVDNVFTDILGPAAHTVEEGTGTGLEVHSRRRPDYGEFTVLLNNMRVMVIPAWWVAAREYIFIPPPNAPSVIQFEVSEPRTNQEDTPIPYELKINVTNSELVAVEDFTNSDTTALTLRSTTVINWRPLGREGEKPLSCSLNHCELFTCVLGKEQETALSILDPVTVGVELSGHAGALELTIQQTLNIRLSYHDVIMLAGMLKSLTEQASMASANNNTTNSDNVRRLVGLGFSENDCIEALSCCQDDLEEAALWLTRHAIVREQQLIIDEAKRCRSVILTATCIILTFIDDCGDSDVPLLELCFNELTADQSLTSEDDDGGTLQCKVSCDYYNRALSGWEPCIEPWKCEVSWRESSGHRFLMDVCSDSLLDVNLTSSLIELYKLVGESWRRDMETEKKPRRRFVPFALKNDTGMKLGFATSLSSRPDDENGDDTSEKDEEREDVNWKWVDSGETVPFEYQSTRRRQRHGDTHRARMHGLKIRIQGFRKHAYVSVDRVGVYFRDVGGRDTNSTAPDKARVVFDVTLDGQARKLITVRSALVIHNKLPSAVDVRLGPSYEYKVKSSQMWSVPLEQSHQKLRIRPAQTNYLYCQPEIDWRSESRSRHEIRLCRASSKLTPYHFSAYIRSEVWPLENALPSHMITLLPSVLLVNLLPHDLHYSLRRVAVGTPGSPTMPMMNSEGVVTAGTESAVNTTCAENESDNNPTDLELRVRLEGFNCCSGIRLSTSLEMQYRIRLEDTLSRRLTLHVTTLRRGDTAALRIIISAPFWILNRTGLPLMFRQEGVTFDAAGQYQEHEVARMVAPLLFSWMDSDASPSLICRVGSAAIAGQPMWSQNFHLRRGVQVRRLRVAHGSYESKAWKPDTVYVVGIEVRSGRGRYRHTNIVTVSPRHQLHNRTSHTLIFSQQCHAGTELRSSHVKAVSGCQVPFHWPRPDKDLLICISAELSDGYSLWSGGILIDTPRSLHIALRDSSGATARFLRLEVVTRGASLHAIFAEASESLPPPLRVDNRSEVTITFSQRDVPHECIAKAGAQVPYAWDEPDARSSVLMATAPGGATAYCDMERLGPVAQLTYENFIYVAFLGTFTDSFEDESLGAISDSDKVEYQRLVLDVAEDSIRVSLARKQPGRRSQLWRMTSTGQLQHVGSPADRVLVLDIEGPAPQPAKGDSRLALRRPDPRRRTTQTWRFTVDGRLCCAHENMCVQPREALWGLRSGGAAVLAPSYQQPFHRKDPESTPLEQYVGKQRMRPGSGFLSVEVTTDGPTRVLSIRDDISERNKPSEPTESDELSGEFRIVVRLSEGLGLSLVGKGPPQELVYARLVNLVSEITRGRDSRQLCLSVGDIQFDNQLFGADTEIVLYTPTRIKSSDSERQGPALSVSAEIQAPNKKSTGVRILRHLVVKINALVISIEEQLLLRLAEFFGVGSETKDTPQDQEQTDDLVDEAKPQGADGVTTSMTTK